MSNLKEYCGVFGLLQANTDNIGQMIYYGMYALQHRGQESCGMAVFDNFQLRIHKDMGLVNQVFSGQILEKMTGQVGIGHTRYSTTGGSNLDNAQPVVARSMLGAITVAHNGNLTNTEELSEFLGLTQGLSAVGDSDSHILAQMISYELQSLKLPLPQNALVQSVKNALARCEGAYSVAIATGDTLIAARDKYALRPLCYGKTPDGAIVVASETCALDIVGAHYIRDIQPGEIFVARMDGSTESLQLEGQTHNKFCFFELVYFARPDSIINDSTVYAYRHELGRQLAKLSPDVEADVVIPVPDSGNVAAVGYSQESGIPYMEGLIKNRYVGRTFIQPTQQLRERGIRLKLNPLHDMIEGKRVVVVDDSIVRGNTSRNMVKMLKECGVKEIHLRISSAMVKHPCFYGIDMSQPEELIANRMGLEEMREWLGVDSLVYLTVDAMRDAGRGHDYCMACFNNNYPAGVPKGALTTAQVSTV